MVDVMSAPTIKPKATIWLSLKTANWRSMDDVRRACAGKPVKITGTTLDLQGCQIAGTKLPKPKNENSEDSEPLRISIPRFTLENGSARGIPGGILMRETNVSVLNLIILDIGEDGLSNIMDDTPNMTVRNVRCFGASDKSFQFNDARGLTFVGNYVEGGITGVRLQKKATKYDGIKTKLVANNQFVRVDTAWHLAGGVTVVATGSKYERVNTRWVKNDGRYSDK